MTKIISLSILALAISMANAVPTSRGNIVEYSDPDVVDAKNLGIDLDVLSDDRDHRRPAHWSGHKSGHKSSGSGNVVQYSDPDVVDAKNAKVGVDILKRHGHGHEGGIYQYSDPDVLDLKNLGVGIDILKRHGHEGGVYQYSDPDVVDAKNAKVGVHILDGRNLPSYEQYSDPDVVDAKNFKLGVDVLKRHNKDGNVVQYSDPDVVDVKNLKALIDILRRNDYEVVKRSSMAKRSDSDMWQYEEDNHQCYCAKKPGNHAPVPKPSSTPTHHHTSEPAKSTPTWTSHKHHHTSEPAKSTPTTSAHKHHHTSEPAKSTSHKHHHHEPTSTSSADKGKPTHTPKSCPSGYKHANGGSVIQYSDPDLIDLKNLQIDLSILSNNGSEEKKTVPAKNPPKCTGDYCCYKWNDESVKQISDPDLIDAKNAGINISLLSGNDGRSGLVGGLLGGLGL